MGREINKPGDNMILRLHPLNRVLLSLAVTLVTLAILLNLGFNRLQIILISWDVFALTMLILCWVVLLIRPTDQIRKWARTEDGSKIFVFLLILITSLSSLVAVTFLITSASALQESPIMYVSLAVLGILLSWSMVHTTFTFHYAHLYYDDDEDENSDADAGGLDFPKDKEPDYLDFAYFSFVIGMTFQVSDVQITRRNLRRHVLIHGLISFALNTFVVALTINLIAGFKR